MRSTSGFGDFKYIYWLHVAATPVLPAAHIIFIIDIPEQTITSFL